MDKITLDRIKLAHPKFRDELSEQYKEINSIHRQDLQQATYLNGMGVGLGIVVFLIMEELIYQLLMVFIQNFL